MRQTRFGARESNVFVRLVHPRARAWTVALVVALLSGQAAPASASNYLVLTRERRFQPGPSSRPLRERVPLRDRTTINDRGGISESTPTSVPDSTLLLTAAPALFSETYWTAFAGQDLLTLRQAARTSPEAQFADAMTLLAEGNHHAAESLFVEASQQAKDLNVAVAAQVMLAATLRYERKWTQLRDLPENSKLGPDDRKITSDLESWGKAFADAEPEVTTFPDQPVRLRMKVTPVGTPTVRVRVNGKDYEFWVDTGSSMTVLSSSVAADAKVEALSSDVLTVRTFAGSASVKAASVKRLEIGGIVFAHSPAVIIDRSLMYLRASAEGVPQGGLRVDGIIGWDIIRQLDVTMNYGSGWIEIRQPQLRGSGVRGLQNLAWLGKPFVEVRSNGGTFHFTLDTGAQTTFLNATALEKTGVSTKSSDNRVYGIARTGRETTRAVPWMNLEVGGKSLRLEDVIVYGPVVSGLINSDGILGSDVARFGAIHIDATNGLFTVGASLTPEDASE